jgi:acetolactate synthase-1/2/3 large subunit
VHGFGVTHFFNVPSILRRAMAEMEALGMRGVTAHSEAAAAYMADGYARARRAPGVCFAQAVGAGNLAAGLRDAYLAGSPVVALTGGPHPDTRYRYLYQEVEDLPMFDAVTKFNVRVESIERLPDLLRQAFRAATSGTPGPVHIEIPGRLGETIVCEVEADLATEGRFRTVPAFRPEPEAAAVEEALALLARAERPVIVAGGGVAASDAGAELVALAERLSIPVATSLNAKGLIPDNHPLCLGVSGTYGRWSANQALAQADLVFFAGSRAGGHVTDNWRAPRQGTTVIQLDVEPAELGRNYPAAVAILGDAKVTLRRMVESVERATEREGWLRHVRELTSGWKAAVAQDAASEATPIRPERLCRELTAALPADAVLVVDTGHAAIWSGTLVDLTAPTQRYIRCAGTLGWALPGAMGVKCALPGQPVICFTGDGGMFYHLSELETAARAGIPVVVVVNNNAALSQTKLGWDKAYADTAVGPSRELWAFRETNFAALAEQMGCLGIRVESPSELAGALARALAAGRPAVVDVVTDVSALPLEPWA